MDATSLPKMDISGTCDAYCRVSLGTMKIKTKVRTADKETMTARWFSELWLPVCHPCISNKIAITIWDHDKVGEDELIGSLSFSWDRLNYEEDSKYVWANSYGAPENVKSDAALEMNMNEKYASHWRGRLLLKIFKETIENSNINKPIIVLSLIFLLNKKRLANLL